jgi:hypothetical protein
MAKRSWFERDLIGDTSEHERGIRVWIRSSAKSAVGYRVTLGLMALALVTAFMTGFAALLLLVPGVFSVAFGVALLNGRCKQLALCRAGMLPIELPDVVCFSDARAKTLLVRLDAARAAIQSAVLAGPRGAAFDVSSALDRIPKLEREVVVLTTRIEYIARFLDSTSLPVLRMTLARVRERGQQQEGTQEGAEHGAPGPLGRAAARCQAQIDAVRDMVARAEALAGQAEEALLTIEGVPARITSLQLRRLEACDGAAEPASSAAATIVETFDALEQASAERTT